MLRFTHICTSNWMQLVLNSSCSCPWLYLLGCLSFSNVLVQTFCEMNLILWKGCNKFKHRLNLRIVCIRLDDKRWRAQVVITGIRYRQRQFIFNFLMKVSWLKIRFLFLLIYPTIAIFLHVNTCFIIGSTQHSCLWDHISFSYLNSYL